MEFRRVLCLSGPTTVHGVQTALFPNLHFPGGPHAAAGNNPLYNGDQVDFVTDLLVHARSQGADVVEVTAEAEDRWCDMIERNVAYSSFTEKSYYFGTNVPGKPRRFLLNSGGRPKLFREIERVKDTGYAAFAMTRRSEEHTSELQSLMRISYAVFCLKKKTQAHSHGTE